MGEEELFISCRNGDLDRVRYSTGIRTETEVTTNDRQPNYVIVVVSCIELHCWQRCLALCLFARQEFCTIPLHMPQIFWCGT